MKKTISLILAIAIFLNFVPIDFVYAQNNIDIAIKEINKTENSKIVFNTDNDTIDFSVEKQDSTKDYEYNVIYTMTKLDDSIKGKNIQLKLEYSLDGEEFNNFVCTVKLDQENKELILVSNEKLPGAKVYFRATLLIDGEKQDIRQTNIDGKLNVKVRQVYNFEFNETVQTFIVPLTGTYIIELWGAKGNYYKTNEEVISGNGAYTAGSIYLEKDTKLYVYTGKNATDGTMWYEESYNGGARGSGLITTGSSHYSASGGGATDVRYFGSYEPTDEELKWNSTLGLNSRIMVAGGGAGAFYAEVKDTSEYFADCSGVGGDAGGLIGYEGESVSVIKKQAELADVGETLVVHNPTGGTQTSGGELAKCREDDTECTDKYLGGASRAGSFGIGGPISGGGGYYGGAGAAYAALMTRTLLDRYNLTQAHTSGAGGSSFISGHTGCVAITSMTDQTPKSGCDTGTTNTTCSWHYSGMKFTDTSMIDGKGLSWTNKVEKTPSKAMPNPNGGTYELGEGHKGSGAARITLLSTKDNSEATTESEWTKTTNGNISENVDSDDEETIVKVPDTLSSYSISAITAGIICLTLGGTVLILTIKKKQKDTI